ncbi:RICIN domain-containing protein [Marinobacter lacisalsi]|uniref:mannuronan 5-epimerase n=1 Tax=Marinobacter lacisalsi TaxID=475979 RepID=A0ABV8QMW1_9GAMM
MPSGSTALRSGAIALALLSAFPLTALADAEVQRSGYYWRATVDGANVYTGTRMFDAVNAAINNMGPGTVNVRTSGSSGSDGGNVYGIRPDDGTVLDFHGNTITANGGELVVPVYCNGRNGVAVRNLNVEGNPRYGVWFRGCSNVTLHNITMNLNISNPVGLGIRVDASTGPARNLTISGNIRVEGSRTHGIETYGVDGFTIGDVTVNNSGGSGLLLNDSRNGTVGAVTGNRNNQGGGYATFRVANNNGPNVEVESIYSRNSGRGFFSVSGSNGTTIGHVDIANSSAQGIFLEDASNTLVLSGSVSNGNPNCQLVRTNSSSLNVSGCARVGTPPSNPGNGGDNGGSANIDNGTFRITPVHSGKAMDLAMCDTGAGTNVQQWNWLNNVCQKWNVTHIRDGYYRIAPSHGPDKALDIAGISTENGANVMIWDWLGNDNQLFRFQSAGTGRWRIIPKHSEKCLDVNGFSQDAGANLVQWTCISGNTNQMFELDRM